MLAGACALALTGVFVSGGAEARVEVDSGYTKKQTYNGALRYLRVDLGYEVTEKDAEAAYLLFRYEPPSTKRKSHGSIEIVEQRDHVKVLVRLPQMPRYHEQVLSDGLMKKLREEYGEPPKKRRAPERPAPDGGADAS